MMDSIIKIFFKITVENLENNIKYFNKGLVFDYYLNKNLELIRYAILYYSYSHSIFDYSLFKNHADIELNAIKNRKNQTELFKIFWENIVNELDYIKIHIEDILLKIIKYELNISINNILKNYPDNTNEIEEIIENIFEKNIDKNENENENENENKNINKNIMTEKTYSYKEYNGMDIFFIRSEYETKDINLSCFIYLSDENGINSIVKSLINTEKFMSEINSPQIFNYELIIYYSKNVNIDNIILKLSDTNAIKICFVEMTENFPVSIIKSANIIESENLFILKPFATFRIARFLEHFNKLTETESQIIFDNYAVFANNNDVGYNYNLVEDKARIPCSINMTLKRDLLLKLNTNEVIDELRKVNEKFYYHFLTQCNKMGIKIEYMENAGDKHSNIETPDSLKTNLKMVNPPFYKL
jgi:hypothetical protein